MVRSHARDWSMKPALLPSGPGSILLSPHCLPGSQRPPRWPPAPAAPPSPYLNLPVVLVFISLSSNLCYEFIIRFCSVLCCCFCCLIFTRLFTALLCCDTQM